MRINKTLKCFFFIFASQTAFLTGSVHASASTLEHFSMRSQESCSLADIWTTRLARTQLCFPVSSTKSEWVTPLSKKDASDLSKYCKSQLNSSSKCFSLMISIDPLVEHVPQFCKSELQNYIDIIKDPSKNPFAGKSKMPSTGKMMPSIRLWASMANKGCPLFGTKPWDTKKSNSTQSTQKPSNSQPPNKPFQIGEVKTYIRPGGSIYQQYFTYLVNVNPNGIIPKSLCLFIDGQPYVGVIGPIAEYPPDSSPKQNCVNPSEFAISYKYPGNFGFDFSLKEYPGAIEGDKHEVTIKWEFTNKPSITTPPRILVFSASGRWTWTK